MTNPDDTGSLGFELELELWDAADLLRNSMDPAEYKHVVLGLLFLEYQHLFKVTSDRVPRWLYLHWLYAHLEDFRRIAASKATTMGHIKRHHLHEALCLVPPAPTLAAYAQVFEPLVERQVVHELESRSLAELRDALLPKLVSGQLRVRNDAELDALMLRDPSE